MRRVAAAYGSGIRHDQEGAEAGRLTPLLNLRTIYHMATAVTTVDDYLKSLPEARRSAISAVRKIILANLPKGYAECMQCGMIAYVVPHELYPAGYHCDPRQPLQ